MINLRQWWQLEPGAFRLHRCDTEELRTDGARKLTSPMSEMMCAGAGAPLELCRAMNSDHMPSTTFGLCSHTWKNICAQGRPACYFAHDHATTALFARPFGRAMARKTSIGQLGSALNDCSVPNSTLDGGRRFKWTQDTAARDFAGMTAGC